MYELKKGTNDCLFIYKDKKPIAGFHDENYAKLFYNYITNNFCDCGYMAIKGVCTQCGLPKINDFTNSDLENISHDR